VKLKKLTMQAFGPYADKVEIDFENNNINEGLLLFTGDTGAGKTSIFDAICFALYGESSGGYREKDSFRSDYADNDLQTFVELEFYYNEQLYKIIRGPKYSRKKKKGDGITIESAFVRFEKDGIKYDDIKTANDAIRDLLGVNINQFRQIVMLAQGDFTKLIIADSDETTELFRKIFNTEIYGLIMEDLKRQYLEVKDDYEDKINAIDNERKDLDDKYVSLDNKTLLDELEKDINEYKNNLEILEKQKEEKNNQWSDLKTSLAIQEDINKKINELNNNKKELQLLKDNNPDIDKDRSRRDYNRDCARDISNALDNIKKNNETIDKNNSLIVELKDKLTLDKQELKKRLDEFKIVDTYNDDNKILINSLNDNKNYYDKLNSAKKIKDNAVLMQSELEKSKAEYDRLSNELQELENAYYFDMCFNVAKQLEDAKPCPVCGSMDHPKIAIKHDGDLVDQDKVKEKQKQVDKIAKTYTSYDTQRKQAIKQLEELGVAGLDLDKEINVVLEDRKIIDSKINDLKKSYEKAKKDLDKLNDSITKAELSLKNKGDNNKSLLENIESENQKLNKIYSNNKTNYEEYLSMYLDDNDYRKLDEQVKKYDDRLINYNVRIENLEKDLVDKKFIETDALSLKCEEAELAFNDVDKKYNDLRSIIIKNDVIFKRIEKEYSSSSALIEKLNALRKLSNIANGSKEDAIKDKARMTFENYIQMYYIDAVLSTANTRLLKMSDDRYELVRKIIPDKANEKLGIAFQVYDYLSDKERNTKDLSGGEKFIVALSLALGISDVISMSAGGIKMNSLFIDEGFGNLDKASLDKAIQALKDISTSGKLVGIISHVEDLANEIEKQVIVKKIARGSDINIIV